VPTAPSWSACAGRRWRCPASCWRWRLLVIADSLRVGIGWADDGPRSGYFPFYIGLLLLAPAAGRWRAQLLALAARTEVFAERSQLAWCWPCCGRWSCTSAPSPAGHLRGVGAADHLLHAPPRPLRLAAHRGVAVGVPLFFFLVFERWFLVPLPKGPLEACWGSEWKSLATWHGFSVALTLPNIGFMLIGIVLGVLIGVLPGLGGANGVAILLPLTFSMNPTSAIIMLSCIYWGALFGGAITSILFNIPGEPWSVATTFDGYPMAQQGRAAQALTAAFTSSFVGALFAVLLITFLAPLLAKFALKFGPAEFFAVQLLTFCSFVGMSKEPPAKTIAAMMLGFALAAVGLDSVTGSCA
jgi:hypothetical protein